MNSWSILQRFSFFFILLNLLLYANDGAYTLSGNQLIPIHESNISIKKEISTITRLNDEESRNLNAISLNILKNLPYAKRGYVFKKYNFHDYLWYIENKNYKSSFSALPKKEQEWIKKIKALKKSDNIDFYGLMDEYEKIYKNRTCLQKSDEKDIQIFLNKLVQLVEKNEMNGVFKDVLLENLSADVKEFYQGILSDELSSKGYAKYSFKKQLEFTTAKKYFEKSPTQKGCYEYVLFHNYSPPVSEAEFSTWINIIKTENGFKISKIEMAG